MRGGGRASICRLRAAGFLAGARRLEAQDGVARHWPVDTTWFVKELARTLMTEASRLYNGCGLGVGHPANIGEAKFDDLKAKVTV